MAVYGHGEKDLNQGDLIDAVPFVKRRDVGVEFTPPLAGLVTANSCDLDKYAEVKHALTGNQKKAWPIQMAPAYSLTGLDAGAAGDVRAGRHRRFFYLPKEGPHQELMVDLWLQQPVPRIVLRRLRRVGTLSPEWLARFWTHSFVSMTRLDPRDVFKGGSVAP